MKTNPGRELLGQDSLTLSEDYTDIDVEFNLRTGE